MSERYKKKTPHFGIPVAWYDDRIHPETEMRKYTIIENMLIAGVQGLTEVVFDDGNYILEADGEEFVVRLLAGGTCPSAKGVVDGCYFHAPTEIRWEGLKPNSLWYLYLRATPELPHQNWAVRCAISQQPLGKGALLLASVDLREEIPVVNTNPDGKVYSADVARHSSDTSSSHGRVLEQDELAIRTRLRLLEGSSVQVGDVDLPLDVFASMAADVAGRRVVRMDMESAGPLGTIVKAPNKVFSVQVQRRVTGEFTGTLGEVGIGYFGEDDKVDSEDEFAIYNTGDEGIPVRALVICG